MKKAISLLIFLFCICNNAFSQWQIGGKIGTNLSQLVNYPQNLEPSSYKQGFNVGIVTNRQFNKWLTVQAELLYSMRGFKEKNMVHDINNQTYDLYVTYNYIDLPIVAKFYPTTTGLNIQTGMQLGFSLSQSTKYGNEEPSPKFIGKKEPLDVGIVFGLAYDFKGGLFLDTKYILGLTDVYKQINGFNNRSIQISLGYFFRIN